MKHVGGLAPAQYNQASSLAPGVRLYTRQNMRISFMKARFVALFTLLALLLSGSLLVLHSQLNVYAANQGINATCTWYNIRQCDTLNSIARTYHITSGSLASINHIANKNIIFVGQRLCITNKAQTQVSKTSSGLLSNGSVRWYAYKALDRSSKSQVSKTLRRAAARHGLPANLLLAIAWQESGWTQHVISRDGGIGTMQIMPYTATELNAQTHVRRDPYKLIDNVELGATYLHSLWRIFHGNHAKVISAYNEGGWNVVHRGIFNWHYVNNVQALMRKF
jgi:LysM repeat protein